MIALGWEPGLGSTTKAASSSPAWESCLRQTGPVHKANRPLLHGRTQDIYTFFQKKKEDIYTCIYWITDEFSFFWFNPSVW